MELDQLLQFFQATLVPVVMISGIGLMTLIIQTRYSRVVDSARRLNQERIRLLKDNLSNVESSKIKDFTNERLIDLNYQIEILIKRGQILKYSLFSTFLAIFAFIFTSFLIIIQVLTKINFIIQIIAIVFFIGMFLLLVGGFFVIYDIRYSYDAVLIDLKILKYGS